MVSMGWDAHLMPELRRHTRTGQVLECRICCIKAIGHRLSDWSFRGLALIGIVLGRGNDAVVAKVVVSAREFADKWAGAHANAGEAVVAKEGHAAGGHC